jgi:hypothetical protein
MRNKSWDWAKLDEPDEETLNTRAKHLRSEGRLA